MPETRDFTQEFSTSSNASVENHNLDEAIRRLEIRENLEGDESYRNPYPDRPGEPDCIYYMRTGLCGYGNNCRYNHPTFIGKENFENGELPERVGQPDCQYFLKTGMCKFGTTCKYHHPPDRHDMEPVPLNVLGLPIRQDEKSCPFYMKTGTCKFGVACKFNHPQPATVFPSTGSPVFGLPASSREPTSSFPLVGVSAWPLSNKHPFMPSQGLQRLPTYMPVILPPSTGTLTLQQGWTTYTGTVSHLPSTDAIGSTPLISRNRAHSEPPNFPERPDQPECQYYIKTGSCKYGSTCKYHHPKGRNLVATSTLGPLGLPLRPGQPVCSFYNLHGTCRYGPACKFDHPLFGYYNYVVPTISHPDSQMTLMSTESMLKTTKHETGNKALTAQTSSKMHNTTPAESTAN
ncbi:hypothetical protein HPP92_019450 [Vanilla planifolia]|uniref:C3H1-type domain-containing protein n=1 Tax=Vanilla planifolia TaxID=51239 RepID=A0A835Q6Y8_VANPL|nr:hypothetical protein HPP92_019450 [Vanilla planifolia]